MTHPQRHSGCERRDAAACGPAASVEEVPQREPRGRFPAGRPLLTNAATHGPHHPGGGVFDCCAHRFGFAGPPKPIIGSGGGRRRLSPEHGRHCPASRGRRRAVLAAAGYHTLLFSDNSADFDVEGASPAAAYLDVCLRLAFALSPPPTAAADTASKGCFQARKSVAVKFTRTRTGFSAHVHGMTHTPSGRGPLSISCRHVGKALHSHSAPGPVDASCVASSDPMWESGSRTRPEARSRCTPRSPSGSDALKAVRIELARRRARDPARDLGGVVALPWALEAGRGRLRGWSGCEASSQVAHGEVV